MPGLLDKRLWVVSGKGGVGKSSVSAALALASARAGKRTLVCEINATERLTGLLGHRPVGPNLRQLEPNLWAVNAQPQEAMREYALMVLRFETLYKAVFENRLVKYFLRFIPSLQELVLLGKVLYHVQETLPDGRPKYDTVVMDAPATGHAISFLSVPHVLLQTVPPGPMSKEALKMRDLLVDPRTTAAILVSLPEEMPVNETLELHEALRDRVKMKTHAAVLNQAFPERFSRGDLDALEAIPELHTVARVHHDRANLSVLAQVKLERNLGAPVHVLPRLYRAAWGREGVEELSRLLEPLVKGGGEA